jgi:hypothetical protein
MQRPALQVDFLLWLDRYVGSWDIDGERHTLRRRNDGWLEARGPEYQPASLPQLLARGRRTEPAQSPLGMYPVLLSQTLMEIWLRSDQVEHLRNAWRVGPGIKLILKAIEQSIRESDEATRREKFEKMWLFGRSYDEPWSEEDSEVYERLRAEHAASTSKEGRSNQENP